MRSESESDGQSALIQLRAYLGQQQFPADARLPPERDLCRRLGVTRTALRKALATLEQEGQLWRHVGKGTFVGPRPVEDLTDITTITKRTNPAEVMQARLAIEPQLARLAALNASPEDLEEMRLCLRKSRAAQSWRQYESWDNALHRAIAEATRNTALLSLFDVLNSVRRAVAWGRLRRNPDRPAVDHHSFAEHETLVAAIAERDMEGAAEAMRSHLETVARNLLNNGGRTLENGGTG